MAEATRFLTSDGYELNAQVYRPDGWPRALLLVFHGIRSHAGWYTRSCEELRAAGIEVHFLDRRGSGRNSTRRGDTPSFRRLIHDTEEYLMELRRSRPWLPIFVAGISWGGKLALALAARRATGIAGTILLCPGIAPKVGVPLLTRFRIAVARLLRPTKLFPIPLNEPELFTANDEARQYIARESLGLREATARFLFSSTALDFHLLRIRTRVTTPVVLFLAGKDRVIDNARTRAFVASFPSRDNRVIDYPEAEHTLEFEACNPFVTDMLQWICQRCHEPRGLD